MSADNGIYIAKFDSGFIRVSYGSAIENVTFYPKGSQEELDTLKEYFGDSPLFKDEENAILYAHQQAKKYEYLEYGVSTLSGIFPEFDEEVKKANQVELKGYYLKQTVPTHHEIWKDDKKIAHIHPKDKEEVVRMIEFANSATVIKITHDETA